MKVLVFFLFCFFSFTVFSAAKQPARRHLFVEWQHWDDTIVLGELTGRKFKRTILLVCPIKELKSADVSKWLGETANNKVLLFFHAMWGQQPSFHRKSLRSIQKTLENQPNGIQTVISFIWHAGGLAYSRNWTQASEKGEPLGDLIRWISLHYSNRVNVLCHSMGSRFFEGMLRTANDHYGESVILDKVILFSPDLDADVADPDLIRLCNSAKAVVVFVHRRDRLLIFSSWALGRDRLGRSGPKGDIEALYMLSHLLVIDMTDHVQGIINHTHLNKEWVQQRLQELL